MKKFFSSLRQLWQEVRNRRRYAAIIDPAHIRSTAQDLVKLVQMSLCRGHMSQEEAQYLQTLQKEMQKLINLTEVTSFRRLPAQRRVTLYHNLQRSHEKLLEAIQNTDAPTTRIQ